MDLLSLAIDNGLMSLPEGESEGFERSLFVAPFATVVPDDGYLHFVTISRLKDVFDVPNRSVVLFGEEQSDVLRVLCEHSDLFETEIRVMHGVPSSAYEPWFDDATFGKDRISYAPFVSELSLAVDAEKQRESMRDLRTAEAEDKRLTRKTGERKFASGVGAGALEEVSDAELD